MKKVFLWSLVVVMVISMVAMFSFTGCKTTTTTTETTAAVTTAAATTAATTAAETYKISLIPQTLSNPFFIAMKKGAEQAVTDMKAKGINIDLSVQAPKDETDAEAQLSLIENAITGGADAIIFPAISPDGLIPGVLSANKAGVKVINVDCGLNFEALAKQGGKIVCYLGSDNVEGGRIAGKAMGEYFKGQAGPIEVGLIEGLPGHANAEARKKGFLEGIGGYSNVKVVASQTANWAMDQAYTVMQNMIQAHPNLKAIFACSDQMGLGAISAIKDAGKTGTIIVFSFDATVEGLKAIADGTMYGSVAQYPSEMGRRGVEIAIDVLTNPNAVYPDKIWTTVKLITKDNLSEAES
jgi:ABC-type sugar transport system substrate-binding protein